MSSPAGAQVLIVAFSGGADSVLTAHWAAEKIKTRPGSSLLLWYLHHYNTPIETERLKVFAAIRTKFPQVKLLQAQKDIATLSRRLGYSWEHTASLVRRKRLLHMRAAIAGSTVVTGHNYSDYLETLALRRERKIPEAALPVVTDRDATSGFLRPLYKMTRDEVRAMVLDLGLAYYDDPSNKDEKFARNRLRKQPRSPGEQGAVPEATVPSVPAVVLENRELSMPIEHWEKLSSVERARTTFAAFRCLAVVRKFTRNHFARAHHLPFSLPPFFVHGEADRIIFRRGLGKSPGLPKPGAVEFLYGNQVTRRISIAQKYGRKAIAKIFSEKKLSPRQKRQTLVYLVAGSLNKAHRIVFHTGETMDAAAIPREEKK